ncbi:MAG: TetR family transcriptional regulator, partial [Microcella sp.]|nr:TetR family transcriptional regulator [Microcella sp.]
MAERKTARKSSDERRDDIIRATLTLVARRGFAGVTLREVATEVGVVHGLIRHYFASRDELVAAAFDFAVVSELESDRALLDGLDPVSALAGWLAATPEHHYRVWFDAWSEAPRTPALAAALDRHHRD